MEENTITFSNISDSRPSEASTEESSQPSADQQKADTQTAVGSHLPENVEKTTKNDVTTKPETKVEGEAKAEKEVKKEEAKAIEELFKFAGKDWNLNELTKEEVKKEFLQALKDNELRRADYSRKTAELAEMRKNLEFEKQKTISDISDYLNSLTQTFNQTPLLFLRSSLERDENGNLLSPEQVEERVAAWIERLTGEIKMGAEYNPERIKKQYELEERLRKIEREKELEAKRQAEEKEKAEALKLRDYIINKIEDAFPKESELTLFVEHIPAFKQHFINTIINEIEEAYKEAYIDGDPSWDDYRFIDSLNFKSKWEKLAKQYGEYLAKVYDSYVNRKKESSKKKSVETIPAAAASKVDTKFTWDML